MCHPSTPSLRMRRGILDLTNVIRPELEWRGLAAA
jgi:hypothetical protein